MVNSTWQVYRALEAKAVRVLAISFFNLGTLATSTRMNPAIRD